VLRRTEHSCAELDRDAVAPEARLYDLGRVRLLLRQKIQADDRHLRAEAAERLTEFAPDGAGTEHDEAARQFGEPEDVLVGEVLDLTQPWHREDSGARAAGDDRPSEFEASPIDLDEVAADEPAFADVHIDAERPVTLHGVVVADAGTQPSHAFHHCGEVDARAGWNMHAKLVGVPHLMRRTRRTDQSLRRHAPDVQAIAAHQMLLDERHLCPEAGRRRCSHQAGRAGADHHEVVAALRRWVGVRLRANVAEQRLVVGIQRRDQR
jgi:hypothetical protein